MRSLIFGPGVSQHLLDRSGIDATSLAVHGIISGLGAIQILNSATLLLVRSAHDMDRHIGLRRAAVLITFCMTTIIPLRILALVSNVLFMAYGLRLVQFLLL